MTARAAVRLEILAGPDALAARVADWLTAAACARPGPFAICLSGGSTPRRLYEILATPLFRETFPWSRTHWFWGDERFVPPDDVRSNFRMAREALLARAPIPAANIHPVPTGAPTPEAAALAYERELKSFYGEDRLIERRPLFDATLLGLGRDGHTASLFPGAPALREGDRWVAAIVGVAPEPRVTLTFPALESSARVALLVSGAEKREVLARLLRADAELPAAHLRPAGEVILFADAAAAGR
jgi:6-phosphogluconolactonase